MIVNVLDKKNYFFNLTVESPDDLWLLRRFVKKGDTVTSRTSRVIKREESLRPEKGERVKVTITLIVEQIFLDSTLERLRIRGRIIDASNDSIPKSTYHTVTVKPGTSISIRKQSLEQSEIKLLKRESKTNYLLVAIDRREAGIGILSGSHLKILASLDSGISGKLYKEQEIEPFIQRVLEIVAQNSKDAKVIVAGPGNTKEILARRLQARGVLPSVIHGFDGSGSDGVRMLIKEESFRKVARDSEAVVLSEVVEETIRRISLARKDVAFSFEHVRQAAEIGAVDACVVSDDVFKYVNEEGLVETLNKIESMSGRVYVADTTLEYGKKVSYFGGIIALLRFPVRA